MNTSLTTGATPAEDVAKVTHELADVTVYEHTHSDGTRYLVIDIDNETDDRQPIAVYINDAPVFGPPRS